MYNDPKRNWKQCLCKNFEGQIRSIMVFLIETNSQWAMARNISFQISCPQVVKHEDLVESNQLIKENEPPYGYCMI